MLAARKTVCASVIDPSNPILAAFLQRIEKSLAVGRQFLFQFQSFSPRRRVRITYRSELERIFESHIFVHEEDLNTFHFSIPPMPADISKCSPRQI